MYFSEVVEKCEEAMHNCDKCEVGKDTCKYIQHRLGTLLPIWVKRYVEDEEEIDE